MRRSVNQAGAAAGEATRMKIAIWVLSLYSASVTLSILVWVAKKGGLRYLLERLSLVRYDHIPPDWQDDWVARHRALPNTSEGIVFAGDSITASTPWSEYYSDIRNRGIGGDTSVGLRERIDEIAESLPKQLFINIGTNDLSSGVGVEEVAGNIRQIVAKVRSTSPTTEIYVVSV